jgi:hypothetical protein
MARRSEDLTLELKRIVPAAPSVVTEVVLTQGPFKTPERRTLHCDGWTDAFDRLERLLSVQA